MNTLRQILIFFSLLISINIFSQVSSYTFTQTSGTYTPITGGVSLITATANTSAGSIDSWITNITFPFTFTFNGVGYNGCTVSSNGFITFGATTPLTTTSGPITSTIAYNGAISPWGGDINALFNLGGLTGEIRWQTVGTAPNREIVIQWRNFRPNYSTSTLTTPYLNFQVRLSETTNIIRFHYGQSGNAVATTTNINTTRQIGLRGSTNADFNIRTNSTIVNFNSSTAGLTNAAVQSYSSVNATPGRPNNGLIYQWTPPSCVAPTSLTNSSITTTSATISWTASSPIPSNGYQYYLSTSSTNPTAGTTPTGTTTGTSVNLTGLIPNTTYYWWVRSNCGGTQSSWAGVSTFFTGNPVCTNTSSYGSATAGTNNTPVTISSCNYQSEYSTVSGIVAGNTYSFGYSLGGYITIRTGTYNGTPVASGNAPLTWVATTSGTVYVHYNTNSACGTLSSCGTSTVTCTSCPAPVVGCTNTSFYPAAFNAPTTNAPYTIATDQWQEEYNQVDNVIAGSTFQSSHSLGGFITVRYGSFSGTVVATGNSTLSWTATNSGSYFIHYTTDNLCNTAINSGTSTLTCTSCSAPSIPNDLVCNATSIICGSNTNGTTIGATSENLTCSVTQTQPGVWYSVVGNGQVMTASLCATAWDSKISVFQGTCSSLTCVGGIDDNGPGCTGTSASYSWTSVNGTTYYILVHGYSTNNTFTLNLTCTNPPPSDPTSISVSSSFICSGSGNNVTLTANGVVGTVYWFNGSCGTTGQIGTGNSIVVTPTSTTTYYARNFNNSLFSTNCVNTTIEVRTPPSVIAGSNVTICEGNNTQLGATASTDRSLTILTNGTNGCTGGNMFDVITNTTPITITSFDITPNITGAQSVNVYYRNGTYVGNETNSLSWTLLGTYTVNGTIDVLINMPITPLSIPINSTYGIYINYDANYSNATTSVNDAVISVNAGVGLCGSFSGVNASRTFNGKINYQINPTVSWNPSSTLSANNILNPIATPTATTTYTLTGTTLGCSSTSNITVTVNTLSTTPTVSTVLGRICPNTNTTLTASGGIAGTGSSIKWYSGPNGTGTLLTTGNSLTLPYNTNTTIYVRREGTCNNTSDSISTVNVRQFMPITTTSSVTPNYCVDNDGWGHWYNGNDEIIFSAKGDFSMCNTGYPNVTINKTNTFYNQTQQPTSVCLSNQSPGEMRFEMGRNWNVDMGGATPSGLYTIRFYFVPSERTDVINAAIDTMVSISNCGYSYKYNPTNGWFWFKNQGSNYVAPQWDGVQYDGLLGLTSNNVTYVEMDSIQGFSGGSGGVILVPNSILPIKWKYFNGETDNEINYLRWVTETETNTDYFEVERGQDGINFESISLVNASQNSLTDKIYNYTDETPYIGQNYYRIKLYNLDGSVEYSNIIVLNISKNYNYHIYPNPFDNTITYSYNNTRPEFISIEIINLLGQSIYNKIETSTSKLVINLNDLIHGFYKIKIKHLDRGYTIEEFIIKK